MAVSDLLNSKLIQNLNYFQQRISDSREKKL